MAVRGLTGMSGGPAGFLFTAVDPTAAGAAVYGNASSGWRFNDTGVQYFGNQSVNYVTYNTNNRTISNTGGVSNTGCINPGTDVDTGWAQWNGNDMINQNRDTATWRTTDFSMQWWYKGTDSADINNSNQPNYNWGAGNIVFGSDRNDVSGGFGMNAGKAGWGNMANDNQKHHYSNSTINDGNWHQVVITNDNANANSSTSKIYIDGSLNSTMTYDPGAGNGPIAQGCYIVNGHYAYPSVSAWAAASRMDLWTVWFADKTNTPVLTAQNVSDLYTAADLWE